MADVVFAVGIDAAFDSVVVGLAFLTDVLLTDVLSADVLLTDVFSADVLLTDVFSADVFLADVFLADVFLADVFLADFGPEFVNDAPTSAVRAPVALTVSTDRSPAPAERFPVAVKRARLAASCEVEGVRPFGGEVLLGIGYSVGGCDAAVVGAGSDGSVDGVVGGGGMVVVTGCSGRGTAGRFGCSFCQHD